MLNTSLQCNNHVHLRLLLPIALSFLVGYTRMGACQGVKAVLSAEQSASAISRAERFLADVATLSPIKNKADLNRSQAWPRGNAREGVTGDPATRKGIPRSLATTVEARGSSMNLHTPELIRVYLLGSEIEVEVVANGTVVSFFDEALHAPLMNEAATDTPILRQTAVERAERYLRAASIDMSNLVAVSADLPEKRPHSSAAAWLYSVHFVRMWQGVPYSDQGVRVSLDASAGRLVGFGAQLDASDPNPARLLVSRERAAAIASLMVTNRNGVVVGNTDMEMMVVMPNTFWQSPLTDKIEISTAARPAWVVRMPFKFPTDSDSRWATVFVDVENGNVLGGDIATLMGKAQVGKSWVMSPGGTIGASMRAAEKLCIVRPRGSSIVLTPADGKAFYGAISGTTGSKPIKATVQSGKQEKIEITGEDGHVTVLKYDRAIGVLLDETGHAAIPGPTLVNLLSPSYHVQKVNR
jgi:hypothetical protein